MEKELQLNGKKFISAKRAAEISGYSSDYVGQLIRAQKISGTLVGRSWYVDKEEVFNHKKLNHLKTTKKENKNKSVDFQNQENAPEQNKKKSKRLIESAEKNHYFVLGLDNNQSRKAEIDLDRITYIEDSAPLFVQPVKKFDITRGRYEALEALKRSLDKKLSKSLVDKLVLGVSALLMSTLVFWSFASIGNVDFEKAKELGSTSVKQEVENVWNLYGEPIAIRFGLDRNNLNNNVLFDNNLTFTSSAFLGWGEISNWFSDMARKFAMPWIRESWIAKIDEQKFIQNPNARVMGGDDKNGQNIVSKTVVVESSDRSYVDQKIAELKNYFLTSPTAPNVTRYYITNQNDSIVDTLSRPITSLSDVTISGNSSFAGSAGLTTLSVSSTASFTGSSTMADLTVTEWLNIGTTTNYEALTLDGALYLGNNSAPANTTYRLYNTNSGDLYWNGSIVAGASVGSWTTDGTSVWRTSGNVGLGTTTPTYKLTVTDTSASQLSLSAGAGIAQWAFRNAGGNLYFSTTTVAGTATSSLAALTIDANGNVGVATTSPVAGFAVATHCVTGDTRLRRRRRRKSTSPLTPLLAKERGAEDGEYIYDEVMIKDVEEGDEIQSLDEKTGTLVWSKVNKLMYMGEKEIWKITTSSGKTIRTTGEHPYLVKFQTSNPKSQNSKPKLGVFYDNSNMFYAQKKAGWKIDFAKLKQNLSESFDLQFINFYTGVPTEDDLAREGTFRYLDSIKNYVTLKTKPLKYIEVPVEIDGQTKIEKKKKGDVDVEITLDMVRTIEGLDVAMVISGDSDYLPLRDYVLKEKNKKIIFAGFRNGMAWELTTGGKYLFFDNFDRQVGFGESIPIKFGVEKTTPELELGVVLLELVYSKPPSLSSGGVWTKVKFIEKGQDIAVTNGKNAVWDKIVKIEKMPSEPVYDIEVEGTHNFIGNDIVAHNTYLGGNLTVQGATRLDSSLTLSSVAINSLLSTDASGIVTATSAPTFGRFNATSTSATSTIAGGLTVDGNTLVVDYSTGRVGVGTASPTGLLEVVAPAVAGDTTLLRLSRDGVRNWDFQTKSSFNNYLFLRDSDADRDVMTWDTVGRIGIGTTSPSSQLDVMGDGYFSSNLFVGGNITSTSTLILPNLSQGFAYLGTGGRLNSIASSSINLSWFNNDQGFTNYAWPFTPQTWGVSTSTTIGMLNGFLSTASSTIVGSATTTGDFAAGNTLFVKQGGNVGIGTTSPYSKLSVVGDAAITGNVRLAGLTATGTIQLTNYTSGALATDATGALYTFSTSTWTFASSTLLSDNNTWSARQNFNGNASTTGLTVTGSTYLATAGGNVGIGTTNPGYKLEVAGQITSNSSGVNSALILNNSGTSGRTYGIYSSDNSAAVLGTGNLAFYDGTAGVTRMVIDLNGNVGVGTLSPADTLHVQPAAENKGISLYNTSAATQASLRFNNTNGGYLSINNAGGANTIQFVGSGDANYINSGKFGLGTTSPYRTLSVGGSGVFTGGDVLASTFTATSSITTPSLTLSSVAINSILSTNSSGVITATSAPTFGYFNATSTAATSTIAGGLAIEGSGFVYDYSTNNVGIGTASPSQKFTVVSGNIQIDNNQYFRTKNTSGTELNTLGQDSSNNLQVLGGGDIRFYPNAGNDGARVTFASGGNVGIGTTAPNQPLHVYNPVGTALNLYGKIENANTQYHAGLELKSSRDWYIQSYGTLGAASGGLSFYDGTASKDRMVIDSSGNVGIGTTTPGAKLNLYDSTSVPLLSLERTNRWDYVIGSSWGLGSSYGLNLLTAYQAADFGIRTSATSGNVDFVIKSTGNVGIGTTSPASKLNVYDSTADIRVGNIGSGSFGGVSFNGTLSVSDYNMTSSLSDRNLYINRPSGLGIFFKEANGTAQMTIATGGNVGIGTTGPASKLDVNGNANVASELTFGSSGTGGASRLWSTGSSLYIAGNTTAGVTFNNAANSVNLLRLWNGGGLSLGSTYASTNDPGAGNMIIQGNVGIGTTSPGYKLSVQNTSEGNTFQIYDTDGNCLLDPDSGGITTTCSSDARLKTNIEESNSVIEYLRNIPIKDFTVIASGDRRTGVIAQEMLVDYPELVHMGSDGYYGVSEISSWKIIKGLQEQQTMIEDLQNGQAHIVLVEQRLATLEEDMRATSTVATDGRSTLLGRIMVYFKDFGLDIQKSFIRISKVFVGSLHIEGDVCVDDTCVTKDQFKEMILRSGVGAVQVVSSTPEVVRSSDSGSQTSTSTSAGASDSMAGNNGTATTTPEIAETTEEISGATSSSQGEGVGDEVVASSDPTSAGASDSTSGNVNTENQSIDTQVDTSQNLTP